MFNRRKDMMIYAFLGFLEAGKTSIIKDLLKQDLFDRKLKTLIVCCEEGEEEYDPVFLANVGATVAYIEDEKSFSGDGILSQLKKYKPDRIFVEYNGMWRATKIIEFYQDICEILFDRQVMIQTLDIVNDETFSVYMKNMPSLMTEHFKVEEQENQYTITYSLDENYVSFYWDIGEDICGFKLALKDIFPKNSVHRYNGVDWLRLRIN